MYNINLETTVADFIDLQKCKLETELEVLYLSKVLQIQQVTILGYTFLLNNLTTVFSDITDMCRDTFSDHCGKGKVFLYAKLD